MQNRVWKFTNEILINAVLDCEEGGPCPGVTFDGLGDDSGDPLTVTITAAYEFPYLSVLTTFSDIPVTAQTIMVFE